MNNNEQFIELDETYLPEAAELFRSAFAGEPWNDDWSDDERLKLYIKDISCGFSSLNYGLIINGRLAAVSMGTVRHWWSGTTYNIAEFCVSPELQGKGTGSRFMEMIEADIAKRGVTGIYLETDDDKPAFKFYQKNGFTPMTRHISLYKNLE